MVTTTKKPKEEKSTVITNIETGEQRIQSRIPGTNNIVEKDPSGKILYIGSNDAETRAVLARRESNDKNIIDQKLLEQQKNTPKISPEMASSIGQVNPNTIDFTDPLSTSIAANLQGQQDYSQFLTQPKDYSREELSKNLQRNTISLTKSLASPAVKILNKVSFGSQAGNVIVNKLAQDDEVKRIINNFDTSADVDKIKFNIGYSDELKAKAFQQAKTDPVAAKYNYEESIRMKYKTLAQMKALSKDPEAFAKLQGDITRLTDYFDETKGIKNFDDQALIVALNSE